MPVKKGCLWGATIGAAFGIAIWVLPLLLYRIEAEGQFGVGIVLTLPAGILVGAVVGSLAGATWDSPAAKAGFLIGLLLGSFPVVQAYWSAEPLRTFFQVAWSMPLGATVGILVGAAVDRAARRRAGS